MSWPVEVEDQHFREQPEPGQSSIRQATNFLRKHARKLLRVKPLENRGQPVESPGGAKYQRPTMRRIAQEKAKLFLIGRATIGDQGARDIMEIVFLAGSAPSKEIVSATAAAAFNSSNVDGYRPAPDCP